MGLGKIWIHLCDSCYMGQPEFHCIVERASLIPTHDSHRRRTRWTPGLETIHHRALKTPPCLGRAQQKPNKQAITRRKLYWALENCEFYELISASLKDLENEPCCWLHSRCSRERPRQLSRWRGRRCRWGSRGWGRPRRGGTPGRRWTPSLEKSLDITLFQLHIWKFASKLHQRLAK